MKFDSPSLRSLIDNIQAIGEAPVTKMLKDAQAFYQEHRTVIDRLLPKYRLQVRQAINEYCRYLANNPPIEDFAKANIIIPPEPEPETVTEESKSKKKKVAAKKK